MYSDNATPHGSIRDTWALIDTRLIIDRRVRAETHNVLVGKLPMLPTVSFEQPGCSCFLSP